MCMAVFKQCECGRNTVQFHLRDNILTPEVVTRLFCPECPGDAGFDPKTMVGDNGWVIEYDMVLAAMQMVQKRTLSPDQLRPDFIFDQGYACWLETYPGEREEIREEREKILALKESDPQVYLREIMQWNIRRLQELKARGWRRAQAA